MSKKEVQQVSERFVSASIAIIERSMMNDGAAGLRVVFERNRSYCELRDIGEEGLAELRGLMAHPHMAVRLSAAACYRFIDSYQGLTAINRLSRNCNAYPLGSLERKVAFTASAVIAVAASGEPSPSVDPYDAWQKAKEEKAKTESKPKG